MHLKPKGLLTDDLLLVMNEEKRKKLIKWLTVDNDLQIKTCMEVVKFNGIEFYISFS